ncbi:DUF3467 domain-containing protein [Dyella lipolytica]|uniref:DUF3467 domain-containing protein n=1 Tax=Dyella lipolytica TaxID=1867835 RepID=A0ABW8IZ54_9GAMM|nr:DUF3467 domain-containing protein [Dyella lipolytica]
MSDAPANLQRAPVKRSISFCELYANAVNFKVTATDFGLVFVRTVNDENGIAVNEEQAAVSLAPQAYKHMVLALLDLLNEYEAQVGEIKMLTSVPSVETIRGAITGLVNSAKSQPSVVSGTR